jgi:capsular polysaccharide biosynthesis protein
MEELSLTDIIKILKGKWWIILIAAVITTAGAFFYSIFFIKPVYESNALLYIGKNIENDSSIAYNDLLVGERLVNDYREIVKSRRITEMAIARLELENVSSPEFAQKLNIQSKKDTRLIEITAQDLNPEKAKNIVNTVAEVFSEEIVKIMEIKNIQIIDAAIVNVNPIKPNTKMNVAVALVLGIMIGIGLIFLIEFLDNTVRTSEDVVKYVELPVIGTIPVFM